VLVGKEPPFREDMRAGAEESPLLEAVTRKRLVTDNTSLCALVMCKVWKLAMAL
jgi:hypothetical protein